MDRFARRLLDWYRDHGRQSLPWQSERSPYRVWISEVMLQQTQVTTVIPYFLRFIQRFPTVTDLANADSDEVMAHWSGLGYYSRARNLVSTARHCRDQYGGDLPDDFEQLCALPGIGRSTAGAIQALSRNRRHPILDGNVKRVLCRFHAVEGWPGRSAVQRELWQRAEQHTPREQVADYTQAIMDLGATVCTPRRPACPDCPQRSQCRARRLGDPEAFPERKARKVLPERHAVLLVNRDSEGRLLLERRPPSGIWGGLWSLPQFDSPEVIAGFTLTQPVMSAPIVRHTFSHFRLLALPLRAECDPGRVSDADHMDWFGPSQIATLGLPKPIRTFATALFEDQISWQDGFTA